MEGQHFEREREKDRKQKQNKKKRSKERGGARKERGGSGNEVKGEMLKMASVHQARPAEGHMLETRASLSAQRFEKFLGQTA